MLPHFFRVRKMNMNKHLQRTTGVLSLCLSQIFKMIFQWSFQAGRFKQKSDISYPRRTNQVEQWWSYLNSMKQTGRHLSSIRETNKSIPRNELVIVHASANILDLKKNRHMFQPNVPPFNLFKQVMPWWRGHLFQQSFTSISTHSTSNLASKKTNSTSGELHDLKNMAATPSQNR